jgi:ribonuclease P protein component
MTAAPGRPAALGRLKKRSEFLAVAATNRRYTTPGLVLQMRKAEKVGDTVPSPAVRLGFTATKKIGNAVMRNRARRRLRAAVAEALRDAAPNAADLVLVARQGTIDRPFTQLIGDISTALRSLGVVR